MSVRPFNKKSLSSQAELESNISSERIDPKKGRNGEHDESNWLVSYADMMTLLCGFFIMLFSLVTVGKNQSESMRKELAEHFNGKFEKPTEDLKKTLTEIVKAAGIEKETTVTATQDSVSIFFESTLFFDTLSAALKPEGAITLRKLIDAVYRSQISINKSYQITVEGHTDARPIISGPYASNWELSASRAARVIRMFEERGFAPKRLLPVGYGSTQPLVPNRLPSGEYDPTALERNRRVVIRVTYSESAEDPAKAAP